MADLDQIISRHSDKKGQLLPILHDIQAEFGFIDNAMQGQVAQALNLSRAEVHGVVSFYHDFRTSADLRPEVQVCGAEACQARGAGALMGVAQDAAGERVRIRTVYCLGLCSVGPAARIGDRLHARLDKAILARLVEDA
ncbi:MAG: NAD(P)H-dependent oxidoreductase subunit E [Sphingomonadaceae bacterium]|jgi:formate dehydrogenase subunit gamma|nr:NAD(P)H-dependent oxidoreductase subunit E [Sphingomonadaceae bacterium]MCP5384524.1 NAD(P)H-dependent oxidoreductase subunit E [Altererythrobacter sp.]